MIASPAPRPPVALVACSVLVIAGCLFVVAAAVAACTVTWDPCSVIGGAILFPLPATLAIQQYRGTFRRNARAATVSSILLFVVSAFGLFAFVTTLGEMVADGVETVLMPEAWIAALLPILAFTTITGCGGWANRRWSRQLRVMVPSDRVSLGPMRFSLREVLGAFAALAFLTGLTSHFIRTTPPEYAEHAPRDQAPFALPAAARDVSFCQGSRGTIAFEFTIDEDGFKAWVASGIGSLESQAAGVRVKEITSPYSIHRYFVLTSALRGPQTATISNGLYYQWNEEDRGVYAVFDRTTGRAYYFAHSH